MSPITYEKLSGWGSRVRTRTIVCALPYLEDVRFDIENKEEFIQCWPSAAAAFRLSGSLVTVSMMQLLYDPELLKECLVFAWSRRTGLPLQLYVYRGQGEIWRRGNERSMSLGVGCLQYRNNLTTGWITFKRAGNSVCLLSTDKGSMRGTLGDPVGDRTTPNRARRQFNNLFERPQRVTSMIDDLRRLWQALTFTFFQLASPSGILCLSCQPLPPR